MLTEIPYRRSQTIFPLICAVLFLDPIRLFLVNYKPLLNAILSMNYILKPFLILATVFVLPTILGLTSILFFANLLDPLEKLSNLISEKQISFIWISFTISILLSSVATALGYTTSINSHNIDSIQLLLSNFIFD